MSREGDYLVFAFENYRAAKGLTGAEAMSLFDRYNLSQYILDSFELFHIECEANMIAAVDERIAALGGTPPESIGKKGKRQ